MEDIRLEENLDYFYTSDMGLTAALFTAEFQIYSIDKKNPSKATFIFKKDRDLEKFVERYWSDKLVVNARTYFNNLKMLKNRIYSIS